MNRIPDETIRDWLLHRMQDVDTAGFERQLLLDRDLSDRVREIEYDLLDDHARGALSSADHAAIEQFLLDGGEGSIRRHGALALTLRRATGTAAPAAGKGIPGHGHAPRQPRREDSRPLTTLARSPFGARYRIWLGALAACAVLAAVLAWHPWQPQAIQPRIADTGHIASITLFASATRGGVTPTLAVPVDATAVRLQVETDDGDSGGPYTLRVDGPAGNNAFTSGALTPLQAGPYRYVESVVPATAFGAGPHHVTLARDGKTVHVWHVTLTHSR